MERKKSSVRAQFGRRAGAYARSESHARDRDLELLLEHLRLRPEDRALDVATGTGFTAIALRSDVHSVVGLDLTHRMLLEAIRLAASAARSRSAAQGLADTPGIQWVEGDVESLPFRDGAFSVVTCRRAPHHFVHLDRGIGEMLRVLQPDGRIGIVDQISPEEAVGLRLMEDLEALRDASHVHTLTVNEWRAVFERHEIALTFLDVVESAQAFEGWLDLADTEIDRRRAIEQALADAPPEARRQIGYEATPERSFLKRWAVLVGRKR
ncbi:MAG: methyltransferase domain-containing protein [Armatimonadetes bacterium]|nr:methyltransferase domain-containing protein [Armatimonadota bacterium]